MAFLFLLILAFSLRVHKTLVAKPPAPSAAVLNTPPIRLRETGLAPFWPEFPRDDGTVRHSAEINGVQTITEQWNTRASSAEVLSYYREQMQARGWQDVTEETYGLQPELREAGTTEDGLQNPRYIESYREVMNSNLEMRKGDWSIHVSAESSPDREDLLSVKIYAAATPSIKSLWDNMASTLTATGSDGNQAKPFEAVQHAGGQRYHTTISNKAQSPGQAYQDAVADLRAKGWIPMLTIPPTADRPAQVAWMARGGQYAILVVRAAPVSGSSVTMMDVSPE
jgi:hypothetical protein